MASVASTSIVTPRCRQSLYMGWRIASSTIIVPSYTTPPRPRIRWYSRNLYYHKPGKPAATRAPGKTILLGTLLQRVPPGRIVTMEKVPEPQLNHDKRVALYPREPQILHPPSCEDQDRLQAATH